MPVVATWRSYLLDLSERQVDPLPDVLRGLWDFMLPKLLHRARHDDLRDSSINPRQTVSDGWSYNPVEEFAQTNNPSNSLISMRNPSSVK